MEVDKLVLSVELDNQGFQASINKVQKTVDDFSKNVRSKFEEAFDLLLGTSGLNFAKNLVEGFAEAGAKLGFLSQTLHENVQTLNIWQEAVKRVGGTADQFSSTLQGLYDKLNNATLMKDPTTLGILNMLGVSPLQNGRRKDTIQLIEEIGQALQKLPAGPGRALGKQLGIDDATLRLIMMNKGALQSLLDQMQRNGVMNEKMANDAIKIRSTWLDITQQWTYTGYQLADQLMPKLEKLSSWVLSFVNYLMTHKDVIKGAFYGIIAVATVLIAMNPFALWTAELAGFIALCGVAYNKIQQLTNHKATSVSGQDSKIFSNLGQKLGQVGNFIESAAIGGWDAITRAQALKESSDNPNAIGGYNESEKTYGLFQIRPSTASEVMGFNVTPEWLLNPANNKLARDRILAKGRQLARGNEAGALAFYNGGYKGLEHYNRTGHSYNGYAESIMRSASTNPVPQSASLQPGSRTQGVKPGNTNNQITVSNVNMPSVRDPLDFQNELLKMTQPGYAFSSGQIA